jgi:hypothetical protein
MKLLLGYATYIDVMFTIILLMFMSGTLGGEMIATLSGLLLALFFTAARYIFGHSKLRYLRMAGWIVIDFPSPMQTRVKDKFNAYKNAASR